MPSALSHITAALVLLLFCASSTWAEESLRDTVIETDTVWSGTVTIDGVVVVNRRAKLTIAPGTTIRFKRRDRNGDGFGDGEIRVLGGITALGTAEQPIVFESAEASPAPADWSYLLLFTSAQHNTLAYCQFQDAFSGVQVHFSTATISDCQLRNNREGIRFGRAKLTLRHCQISGNHIGVRFTRMEGPAELVNNVITDNQVGIFLVPSGQNIVDFFEPGRTGKPWNEGHLAITGNTIHANAEYNLKLGAKQLWDLQIADNWWGTEQLAAIQATIFDKHRDPDLGQALVRPFAQRPTPNAGPRTPTARP